MSLATEIKEAFEKAKPKLMEQAPLSEWKPQVDFEDATNGRVYRVIAIRDGGEPVVLIPWTRL